MITLEQISDVFDVDELVLEFLIWKDPIITRVNIIILCERVVLNVQSSLCRLVKQASSRLFQALEEFGRGFMLIFFFVVDLVTARVAFLF